ncbi:MAG: DUF58 domain-containing protein [Verrucomicrobia bacterium]|nr:DUF58 domain-containing protein [Verrucomicrobiota bacterium]
MIAPRTSLVVWAAAIILPLSILAGVVGSLRSICVLAIVVFVLATLVDLLLGLGKHRQLEFQIPPVNRVTAGRDFELDLKLNGTGLRSGAIRLVLDLPPIVKPDQSSIPLQIEAGILNLAVPVKAVAEHRGSYPINRLFFDWISPVRFWVFREERPLKSELRVYPDLALEGRKIAHFLDRGGFGVHRQRQIGRGREFEKLREYEPGDSFDSIHWKAAAKRHKPITKVFQVEKSQEVYIAIDSSRLSGRSLSSFPPSSSSSTMFEPSAGHVQDPSPSPGRAGAHPYRSQTILEQFIAATLLAGATAERQGDLFGLITFSDKVDQMARARSGSLHFNHCRDLLINLQARLVAPDFEDIAATLLNRLTKRSLLIFLTSLDDSVTGENFLLAARFLARRHLVMAIMLLPPDTQPLFSAPGVEHTDQIYENIAGHLRWAKLQELRKQLLQAGVLFQLASGQSFTLTVVSEYLATKRRQLL